MKEKILKVIFWDDIGRSKISGRILGIIIQATTVFTFLKVYGIALRAWQMIVIGVAFMAIEITCGWLYVRAGLLKKETDFINDNNVLLQNLKDKANAK